MIGLGHSRLDATHIEDQVSRGKILIVVHGDDPVVRARAHDLLHLGRAHEVAEAVVDVVDVSASTPRPM